MLWSQFLSMPLNVARTSLPLSFIECRQPEARLGHTVLTCPQTGRLRSRPLHKGFTGCLRRTCICMAASRAAVGVGTEGEEVLLMFTDPVRRTWRTGLRRCLARCNVTKRTVPPEKPLSSEIDTHMGTNVYTMYIHMRAYTCSWIKSHGQHTVPEQKVG